MATKAFRMVISEDELVERFRSLDAQFFLLFEYGYKDNRIGTVDQLRELFRSTQASQFLISPAPYDETDLWKYEKAAEYGCLVAGNPRYGESWACDFSAALKVSENLDYKVPRDVITRAELLYRLMKRHFLEIAEGLATEREGKRIAPTHYTSGAAQMMKKGYKFYVFGTEPKPLSSYASSSLELQLPTLGG